MKKRRMLVLTKAFILDALATVPAERLDARAWTFQKSAVNGEHFADGICGGCAVGTVLHKVFAPATEYRRTNMIHRAVRDWVLRNSVGSSTQFQIEENLKRNCHLAALSCVFESEWDKDSDGAEEHHDTVARVRPIVLRFVRDHFPDEIQVELPSDAIPAEGLQVIEV